jgi:hypothetical protein
VTVVLCVTKQEGTCRIYNTVGAAECGIFRVQNNSLVGYNVYVGVNALPDLSQPPAAFSATLPISIPETPPGSGTKSFYVIVRAQDSYGLESQNQYPTVITISSSGGLLLPAIPAPQNLSVFARPNGYFKVRVTYSTANTDEYPATAWKVWAGTTLPNPLVDTPVVAVAVEGIPMIVSIGPFSANTYYVMVGLSRAADGASSPTIYTTAVLSPTPNKPIPVPSGYQGS